MWLFGLAPFFEMGSRSIVPKDCLILNFLNIRLFLIFAYSIAGFSALPPLNKLDVIINDSLKFKNKNSVKLNRFPLLEVFGVTLLVEIS
jgi:hypothetical protein